MKFEKCPYCGCKVVIGYHWLDGKFIDSLDNISEHYQEECRYIQCASCKKLLKGCDSNGQ